MLHYAALLAARYPVIILLFDSIIKGTTLVAPDYHIYDLFQCQANYQRRTTLAAVQRYTRIVALKQYRTITSFDKN